MHADVSKQRWWRRRRIVASGRGGAGQHGLHVQIETSLQGLDALTGGGPTTPHMRKITHASEANAHCRAAQSCTPSDGAADR